MTLWTPWTAAHQAFLFFTAFQSVFKLMSIESVMPPNHLILCCHQTSMQREGAGVLSGEGNSSPLQYSCLENPVDGRPWWAAVHRVAQSRTQLKRLSMHACTGEGNGNPLQCSCLENPVDRRAWWAAVHRVAQSRTQLKRLSSSSSSRSSESLELRGKALQTDS